MFYLNMCQVCEKMSQFQLQIHCRANSCNWMFSELAKKAAPILCPETGAAIQTEVEVNRIFQTATTGRM